MGSPLFLIRLIKPRQRDRNLDQVPVLLKPEDGPIRIDDAPVVRVLTDAELLFLGPSHEARPMHGAVGVAPQRIGLIRDEVAERHDLLRRIQQPIAQRASC